MIGKKNIVFGFVFIVFTVALGPLMVMMYKDWGAAYAEKQVTVGRLQQLKADNFEENLETLSAEAIAKANTDGLLSINKLINIQTEIDQIKGGPHAHGNLEALLNIVVGLVLCFVSASVMLKQIVSWLFILGTVFHSGLLYLERVFHLGWATAALQTGVGPVMILLGLMMMAWLTMKHLSKHLVQDK